MRISIQLSTVVLILMLVSVTSAQTRESRYQANSFPIEPVASFNTQENGTLATKKRGTRTAAHTLIKTAMAARSNQSLNSNTLRIKRSTRFALSRHLVQPNPIPKDTLAIEPFRLVTGSNGALVTVPPNKILVVEFVTGELLNLNSNIAASITVLVDTGTTFHNFFIGPSYSQPLPTGTQSFFTHPIRLYLLPGERLGITFGGGSASGFIGFSGYYIDSQ